MGGWGASKRTFLAGLVSFLLFLLISSTAFGRVIPPGFTIPAKMLPIGGLFESGRLGEWDGLQWIRHSLPSTVYPARISGLDIDTRGRVWLFPNCTLGPMAFFDPAQNRWTAYQDYRDALTHRAHPVKFLHSDLGNMRPIYGPNSQIVFIGQCRGLNYFDGRTWHQWNSSELPGPMTLGELPFFDAAGRLAIDPQPHVFRRGREQRRPGWNKPTTWEWTPDFEWRIVPYEPGPHVPFPNPFAPLPPTPSGCETMLPTSLVHDATGRMWWVAGDALYEGADGQCHALLSGSAQQPFIDGRRLVRALLDAHGNVFLQTQSPFSYVMLKSSANDNPGK
ncbi:MAG: hypothetical protein KGM47_05055 [Acidobacteriota bacterium]|nr:hypothetical protein [Acidobacteriota bacterium]